MRHGVLGLWCAMAAATAAAADREDLPAERPAGELEVVATFEGDMPTGVTVSSEGRIFVNFPRWEEGVETTVAEVVDGTPRPYPSAAMQRHDGLDDAEHFVSVQSVVVGPDGRLWVLDTGRPKFQPPREGGPKLVAIDLGTDEVVKTIRVPDDVALPTTYLNDVRFDMRRGREGTAFITDSSDNGPNGIVVVDLQSGRSWRRLHDHPSTKAEENFLPHVEGRPLLDRPKEGEPKPLKLGSDGIAISADGQRLFYCPLAGRHLYSVGVDALANPATPDDEVARTVTDHGDRGFASDGLESDADGAVYLTNYEDNALLRLKDGRYETIAHGPTLLWPDTLSVAADGRLYVVANQLHRQPRFHRGKDLRERPFVLFRTRIDVKPVVLRR